MELSGFDGLFGSMRGYKGREVGGDPGACIMHADVTAGPAVEAMHMCFDARVTGLLDMGAKLDDENPVLDTIRALRDQHRQRVRGIHARAAGFGRLAARFAWKGAWEEWAQDIAGAIEQYDGFDGCADDLLTVIATCASSSAMDLHAMMMAIETTHRLQVYMLQKSIDIVRTAKAVDNVMGVRARLYAGALERQREDLEGDGLPLHMRWREDRFERKPLAWAALALWRTSRIVDAMQAAGLKPEPLKVAPEYRKAVEQYRATRADQDRRLQLYLPMKSGTGPAPGTMRLDYLGRHVIRPEDTTPLAVAIDEWTRDIAERYAALQKAPEISPEPM